MFVLKGIFEIGNYKFDVVNQIEINHSVEQITDTAIIKMPSKFYVKENGNLLSTEDAIKKGDPVSITLAYEGIFEEQEFTGYVDRIKTSTPMEIHCVDATWLLKRKGCTFSKTNTNLREVLQSIVNGTAIKLAKNIPDVKFDKFTFKDKNGIQALEYIKEQTKLSIYLNDKGELFCGPQQVNNVNQLVEYDLNKSIVENNLEFRVEEDKKVLVVYEATTKDNQKIRYATGDQDGEKIEIKTKNITDLDTLKKLADDHLRNIKYIGYDGDLTSFLVPYATCGMAVKIVDQRYPHREGKYFIKKVVTTFGTNGARRTVSISNKL